MYIYSHIDVTMNYMLFRKGSDSKSKRKGNQLTEIGEEGIQTGHKI